MRILSPSKRRLRAAAACAMICAALPAAAQHDCCAPKPAIRPIDKTCLPSGCSPKTIVLYSGDIQAKYAEVAYVDSFVSLENCEDTVRKQLLDLQAKARVIGADALIHVRKLTNKVSGFQENPETPFWSVKQGKADDYFFRATAIKYLEIPKNPPRAAVASSQPSTQPGQSLRDRDLWNPTGVFDKTDRRAHPQNMTLPELAPGQTY